MQNGPVVGEPGIRADPSARVPARRRDHALRRGQEPSALATPPVAAPQYAPNSLTIYQLNGSDTWRHMPYRSQLLGPGALVAAGI